MVLGKIPACCCCVSFTTCAPPLIPVDTDGSVCIGFNKDTSPAFTIFFASPITRVTTSVLGGDIGTVSEVYKAKTKQNLNATWVLAQLKSVSVE